MNQRGRIFGAIALIIGLGACDIGGCGCLAPLPAGVNLPADQTVEGGAQIRVTPAGFTKLTSLIPAVLNDSLNGFCVPSDSIGIGIGDIDWCFNNDGVCTPGCNPDFNNLAINLSVPSNNTLNVRISFNLDLDVPIRFDPIIGGNSSCNMDVTANNVVIDANIGLGINAASGELEINLQNIPDLNLNFNTSGCGLVSTVINAVAGVIFGVLEVDFIRDLLTPVLDDLIQGLLPDPLGMVGMLDGGSLLPGVAPETNASLEMRLVPGGYAFLENNGMSLGMITGINADEDQSTRTAALDSEPALCVPPFAAPDFAAAPASLGTSSRGNFTLLPADAFRGSPDPSNTDMIIGASETTLDQLGHHLVTSGGMCLGVGTELTDQLTLGTFGLLVPSLAELGEDDAPMLLVTRPQAPIDFTIGAGTDTDPALTLHLESFEIDFYAFIFERYTRAFTLNLTLDAGLNLDFTTDANGDPAVIPVLTGLDSASLQLTVHNAEFIREPAADLEAILPTLLDALLPMLTGGLDPIALPEFAGFALTNLDVSKVTTSEDDFLAISATLGAAAPVFRLAERYPSVDNIVREMAPIKEPFRTVAGAKVASVVTPKPAEIRAGLVAGDRQRLPTVRIDVDTHDDLGRPLEWAWNIDGGIWRPYRTGSPLVIRDGNFVLQGKRTIELMSRVVGDYTTTSDTFEVEVTFDSAPPRIYGEKARLDGSEITIPVTDLVSEAGQIEVAFGVPGEVVPRTDWVAMGEEARIDATVASDLAVDRNIVVYARDAYENVGAKVVDLSDIIEFHGSGDASGCQCDISSASTGSIAGGLAVMLLTLLLVGGGLRRRFERASRIVGWGIALLAISTAAACSCGGSDGPLECAEFEVVICFDEAMNDCTCTADVRFGKVGQYSEIAVAPDNTFWVSAYNSTHGDLMVANVAGGGRIAQADWEYVDGVPDGPVVVPGSDVRGGIREEGPDVGLYTDIAVSGAGTVLVSYFSNDNGGLHAAVNSAGLWTVHSVDEGLLGDVETGFEIAGQYSTIAVRDSDDLPMIAYFVHVGELGERRSELRLARATTAIPTSASDWAISVVETTPIADTGDPNIFNIPEGSGLFVNMALRSDGEPTLAYYDRIAGDLKLAESDGAGGFTISVLDGATGDVGWYPGLALDDSDTAHVSYVSASNDDLMYVNSLDLTPEIADNGYRIVGQTADGLPKPEFHFVGDDSSMVLTAQGPTIVYQDATNHELLVAGQDGSGNWIFETIAGNEDPFVGGYGFYASAAPNNPNIAISSYVVDQPNNDAWVEVFVHQVGIE